MIMGKELYKQVLILHLSFIQSYMVLSQDCCDKVVSTEDVQLEALLNDVEDLDFTSELSSLNITNSITTTDQPITEDDDDTPINDLPETDLDNDSYCHENLTKCISCSCQCIDDLLLDKDSNTCQPKGLPGSKCSNDSDCTEGIICTNSPCHCPKPCKYLKDEFSCECDGDIDAWPGILGFIFGILSVYCWWKCIQREKLKYEIRMMRPVPKSKTVNVSTIDFAKQPVVNSSLIPPSNFPVTNTPQMSPQPHQNFQMGPQPQQNPQIGPPPQFSSLMTNPAPPNSTELPAGVITTTSYVPTSLPDNVVPPPPIYIVDQNLKQ